LDVELAITLNIGVIMEPAMKLSVALKQVDYLDDPECGSIDSRIDRRETFMSVPRIASKLAPWAATFENVLSLDSSRYFISPADLTALQEVTALFLGTQAAVANPEARSGTLIRARDDAQSAYLELVRPMYTTIQANPRISDEDKVKAGVHVKSRQRTLNPVPSSAPSLNIISVSGNVVRLRVCDSQVAGRGKAEAAKGAAIYTFIGANPPDATGGWTLFGNATRTKFSLEFPGTIEAGTRVWIMATWFNTRGLPGPPCQPITTLLLGAATPNALGVKLRAA